MEIYFKKNGMWKRYIGTFEELKPEFDERNIVIGNNVVIGDSCKIENNVTIGDRTTIGYGVLIEEGISISVCSTIGYNSFICNHLGSIKIVRGEK